MRKRFLASLFIYGIFLSGFAQSYKLVNKWGKPGNLPWEFRNNSGFVLDDSSNVYVADGRGNKVKIFNKDGLFIRAFGDSGSAQGQFHDPYFITLDRCGKIYVADQANNRVQKFDKYGNFIRQFGSYGIKDGQLANTLGVAVDDTGNVYITDAFNFRVQKFDSNGVFISKFGTKGYGPGQFIYPGCIVIDNNGNIWVSDFFKYTIQKFSKAGKFLMELDSTISPDKQFYPGGMRFDRENNLYVSDEDRGRIQKFTSDGQYLLELGGFRKGQLISPTDVDIDSTGNVYVLDYAEVQIYAPSTIVTEIGRRNMELEPLKVYPNPSKDLLNIIVSEMSSNNYLELLNYSGQSILKQAIQSKQSQINISELESGIYLYRFMMEDGVKYGKIVKE